MDTLSAQPAYQFFGYLLAGLPILSFIAVLILGIHSHLTLRTDRPCHRLRPIDVPTASNSALKRLVYRL